MIDLYLYSSLYTQNRLSMGDDLGCQQVLSRCATTITHGKCREKMQGCRVVWSRMTGMTRQKARDVDKRPSSQSGPSSLLIELEVLG